MRAIPIANSRTGRRYIDHEFAGPALEMVIQALLAELWDEGSVLALVIAADASTGRVGASLKSGRMSWLAACRGAASMMRAEIAMLKIGERR